MLGTKWRRVHDLVEEKGKVEGAENLAVLRGNFVGATPRRGYIKEHFSRAKQKKTFSEKEFRSDRRRVNIEHKTKQSSSVRT